MFSKQLEFYKSNFETRFCRLERFTRKLLQGYYVCFWTCLSRYMHCMMILTLLGAGCHTVGGESVNSI